MKARIFIFNANEPFDQRVSIIRDIPALIPKNSFFYLNQSDRDQLLEMILASHDIAVMYDIFGEQSVIINEGKKDIKVPLGILMEKSRLEEFYYVCDIGYEWIENEYQLCISLNNDTTDD